MAQTVILDSLVRIPVDDMCGFEVECTRGTRGGTGQHVGAGRLGTPSGRPKRSVQQMSSLVT